MSDKSPNFGKSQGEPPSFFARVPTRAMWNVNKQNNKKTGLTPVELHIFAVLCSYANNQGFAWAGSKTVGEVCSTPRQNVSKAFKKCMNLGYMETVSRFRSQPKWRHVYGTVWRIIYDDRLNQDELIDAMNKEDPPPVIEDDLPLQTKKNNGGDADKHNEEREDIELAVAVGEARWFAVRCQEETGELRLVNPRSVELAMACLQSGLLPTEIRKRVNDHLLKCRQARKSAPPNLGFLLG